MGQTPYASGRVCVSLCLEILLAHMTDVGNQSVLTQILYPQCSYMVTAFATKAFHSFHSFLFRNGLDVSAYCMSQECATKGVFLPSYSLHFALSRGTANAISNFCAEWYLFPERVTYIYI